MCFIEVMQILTVGSQRMSTNWLTKKRGSGLGLRRGGGCGVGYKVKGVQLTLWSLPTNLKTGTWKCFARWSRDVYCFTESSETQLKAGQEST